VRNGKLVEILIRSETDCSYHADVADTIFDKMWRNHPALQATPLIQPCTKNGVSNYDDQCVIRLGIAMTGAGISLASYRGAFCWHSHGRKHPLRVEEMKLWLNSEDAAFCPTYAGISKRKANGWQNSWHAYAGRRGIVVFRNFWGASNQGDHVDLWNGSRIAHGSDDYFQRSQEIWFWGIP